MLLCGYEEAQGGTGWQETCFPGKLMRMDWRVKSPSLERLWWQQASMLLHNK